MKCVEWTDLQCIVSRQPLRIRHAYISLRYLYKQFRNYSVRCKKKYYQMVIWAILLQLKSEHANYCKNCTDFFVNRVGEKLFWWVSRDLWISWGSSWLMGRVLIRRGRRQNIPFIINRGFWIRRDWGGNVNQLSGTF